ncbi:MAG: phosphatase PAP2 family protein [Clostridia bacterium]|nr:phosphatase PAP2 family protein [Clostridia bacterium]
MNWFEISLLHRLHDALAGPFLDVTLSTVTHLGDSGIFWIVLAIVLILIPKTRRVGMHMGLALLFGLLVCNLGLKPLVHRIRPYDLDPTLTLIVAPPSDLSFPSGHAAAAFETAVTVFMHDRRWGTGMLVLASIIAFSRLYLTVHYPTDVLAGILIGICLALFAGWVMRKAEKRIREKRETDA